MAYKRKLTDEGLKMMKVFMIGTREDRIKCCQESWASLPLRQAEGLPDDVDRPARDARYLRATEILKQYGNPRDYEEPMKRIRQDLYKPALWDSSLEIVVTAEVMRRGYECTPQMRFRGHTSDLYVPDLKLFIEADGDYWHSTPESDKRDRIQLAWALACGYLMARLPERNLMADLRGCVGMAVQRAKAGLAYVPKLATVTNLEEQRTIVADMLESIDWYGDPGERVFEWMAQGGALEDDD